jgi:hypothetical protein
MAQVGEGHEPSVRDPVREQPSVARVDHGIRSAVQDQRARADARLPQVPGVQRSRGGLGRPGSRVRRLGVLQLEEAIDKLWMVPDGSRRQGILRVAAPRHLGRQAGGRQDQPHGGVGHGVGEGPARCRAGKDETIDPV